MKPQVFPPRGRGPLFIGFGGIRTAYVLVALLALQVLQLPTSKAASPIDARSYTIRDLKVTPTTIYALNNAGQVLMESGGALVRVSPGGAKSVVMKGASGPFFLNNAGVVAGNGYTPPNRPDIPNGPFIWDGGTRAVCEKTGLACIQNQILGLNDGGDILLIAEGRYFDIVTQAFNPTGIGWGTGKGTQTFEYVISAPINNKRHIAASRQIRWNNPGNPPPSSDPLCCSWNNALAHTLHLLSGEMPAWDASPLSGRGKTIAINDNDRVLGYVYKTDLTAIRQQVVFWDGAIGQSAPARVLAETGVPLGLSNSQILYRNGQDGKDYVWDDKNGAREVWSRVLNADPLKSKAAGFKAAAINDRGVIVGSATVNGKSTTILLIPDTQPNFFEVEYVDPVDGLLSKGAFKTDVSILATQGRPVEGVAADGAAELLVRIKGGAVGDKLVVGINAAKSKCWSDLDFNASEMDVCGGLSEDLAKAPYSKTVIATVRQTSSGPTAFVRYRAPVDFSWNPEDKVLKSREVKLMLTMQGRGDFEQPIPIIVARPLLIFTHGLWATDGDLGDLTALGGFKDLYSTAVLNYGYPVTIVSSIPQIRWYDGWIGGLTSELPFYPQGSSLGVRHAALSIQEKIANEHQRYRLGANALSLALASRKVDAVGHSMGALSIKYLTSLENYRSFSKHTVGDGSIHKFISVGGPHLGSPFAAALDYWGEENADNACLAGWAGVSGLYAFRDCAVCVDARSSQMPKSLQTRGYIGPGAIGDLRGNADGSLGAVSELVSDLQLIRRKAKIRTSYVAGRLPPEIFDAFDQPATIAREFPGDPIALDFPNDDAPRIKQTVSLRVVPWFDCRESPFAQAFRSRVEFVRLMSGESDGIVTVRSQLNGIESGSPGVTVVDGVAHSDWTRDKLYRVQSAPDLVGSELDIRVSGIINNIINMPLTGDAYTDK